MDCDLDKIQEQKEYNLIEIEELTLKHIRARTENSKTDYSNRIAFLKKQNILLSELETDSEGLIKWTKSINIKH